MQSGVRSTSKTRKKKHVIKKSATRAKGMTSSGGILMLSLAHSIQYADSDTTKKSAVAVHSAVAVFAVRQTIY